MIIPDRCVLVLRAIVVVLSLPLMLAAGSGQVLASDARQRLSTVASWHYQLQNIDVAALSKSDADLLVVDHAHSPPDGPQVPLTKAEVDSLKTRPDRRRRIVLAYMSIGEAEDYRYYWRPEFTVARPAWYEAPSRQWPDNHHVHYWMDDWKDIIFRGPGSYLSRIQDAGFDGVYLDRVDAYERLSKLQPAAKAEMMRLVGDVAAAARLRDPHFIVFVQNAEDLLDNADYRAIIDGLAKEDFAYGVEGDGRRNASDLVQWSGEQLRRLTADGKPVLVVEYLTDPKKQSVALADISRDQFVPLFARRALDGPTVGASTLLAQAAVTGPKTAGAAKRAGKSDRLTLAAADRKSDGQRQRRSAGCIEKQLRTTRCKDALRTASAAPPARITTARR